MAISLPPRQPYKPSMPEKTPSPTEQPEPIMPPEAQSDKPNVFAMTAPEGQLAPSPEPEVPTPSSGAPPEPEQPAQQIALRGGNQPGGIVTPPHPTQPVQAVLGITPQGPLRGNLEQYPVDVLYAREAGEYATDEQRKRYLQRQQLDEEGEPRPDILSTLYQEGHPLTTGVKTTMEGVLTAFHAFNEGIGKLIMPGTTVQPMAMGEPAAGKEPPGRIGERFRGLAQAVNEGVLGAVFAGLGGAGETLAGTLDMYIPPEEQAKILVLDGPMASYLRTRVMGTPPAFKDMYLDEAVRLLPLLGLMAPHAKAKAMQAGQGAALAAEGLGARLKEQRATILGEAGHLRLRGEISETLGKGSKTMNDLVTLGATVRHEGQTSRRAFDKAMVEQVGEQVRPHLDYVFEKSKETLEQLRESTMAGQLPTMQKLLKRFKEGEFAAEWYTDAMGELDTLFGPDARLMADLIAATSANTQVDANITKALNLYAKYKAGKTPEQIVRGMHPDDLHRANVHNAFAGEEITGPKVGEFARAIKGDRGAVVHDLWMQRVFGFEGDTPNEVQRSFVADLVTREAERSGRDARDYQASLWVAQKIVEESKTLGRERATELAGRSLSEVLREKLKGRAEQGLPDLTLVDEAGRADVQTTLLLARIVAGALSGATTGEDTESRILNALAGAGLGALASPALIKKLVTQAGLRAQEAALAMKSERGAIGRAGEQEPVRMGRGPAGAEPAGAEGVPAESRINVERVSASDRVKQAMTEINQMVGERVLGEHRQVQGHAQTIAESQRYTLEDVLSFDPSTTPIEEGKAKTLAIRDFHTALVEDALRKFPEDWKPGDPVDPTFYEKFAVLLKLSELHERFGAGFARGIEAQKIQAEPGRVAGREAERAAAGEAVPPIIEAPGPAGEARQQNRQEITSQQILELAQRLAVNPETPPETLAAGLHRLSEQQQRGWLAAAYAGFEAGRDVIWQSWMNALLTNPATHARNILGTMSVIGWDVPERFTAELVNKLWTRDITGVAPGETMLMLGNMAETHMWGLRLARWVWNTGEEAFGSGRGRFDESAVSAQKYGFNPENWFGSGLDAIGSTLRGKYTPLRLLAMEDAYFKGVITKMEMNALSLRQARSEGLTGEALNRRKAYLDEHPTTEMWAEAERQAELKTLNNRLGQIGQTAMKLANLLPFGRAIFPFLQTPINSAKHVGQRMPVTSWASAIWGKNNADLNAGGALKDQAIARIALGNLAGLTMGTLVYQGFFNGGGPTDKMLRWYTPLAGHAPYTVGWGDTRIKYDQAFGPIGVMMGLVADYMELASQIPDQQDFDQFLAYGEALGLAFSKVMVNQTYMRGLAEVAEAAKSPDRNLGRVSQKMIGSMVPAIVHAAARAEDENTLREARTMMEEIKARIPGLRSGVPAYRNHFTGEPVRMPSGWFADMFLPTVITSKGDSKVFKEMLVNKVAVSAVPWWTGGTKPADEGSPLLTDELATTGVRLSPERRDKWIQYMTQTKIGGRTLMEEMEHLMRDGSKYWTLGVGPDEGRAWNIKLRYEKYKQAGLKLLEREDKELQKEIIDARRRKLDALRATTDPKYQGRSRSSEVLETVGR